MCLPIYRNRVGCNLPFPFRIPDGEPASGNITSGLFHCFIQSLQHLGMYPVIGIHKGKQFSLCQCNPMIPRCRHPKILRCDEGQILIALCKLLTDFCRSIRRTIINHNDFQRFIVLCFNTLYAVFQIQFSVVNGNNHTYQWLHSFLHNKSIHVITYQSEFICSNVFSGNTRS